jgi:diguanylate cyclase (GGDEF)-like protein
MSEEFKIGLLGFDAQKEASIESLIKGIDYRQINLAMVPSKASKDRRISFVLSDRFDLIFICANRFQENVSSIIKRITSEISWCDVVVVSDFLDYEFTIACFRAGVRDVLTYPVDPNYFSLLMTKMCNIQTLHKKENFFLNAVNFVNQMSDLSDFSGPTDFFDRVSKKLETDFYVSSMVVQSREMETDKTTLLWGERTRKKNEFKKKIENEAFLYQGDHQFDGLYLVNSTESTELGILKLDPDNKMELQVVLNVKKGSLSISFLDSLFVVVNFIQSSFFYQLAFEQKGRLDSLANTDDVTGLFNQRKLYADLRKLVENHEETGDSFSVIFLDVDRFKSVNDGYGHLVGSQLLVTLAKILRQTVRDTDWIYRYGGDEFVVIFPQADTETSTCVSERILDNVKKFNFQDNDGNTFKLSVSIGVASFPEHAQSIEEIIDLADKMMYKAKQAGRGKVCMANQFFEGKKEEKD